MEPYANLSARRQYNDDVAESSGEGGGTATAEYREAFAQLGIQGKFPGQNVELRFIPIHDLHRSRVTTFICSPVFCVGDASVIYGYKAFQGLAEHDLPFVDRAILAYAVKFARKLASAGTVAAIGASVSFATLASARGREIYTRALCAAGISDCPFLVVKIDDVPSGISPAELAETVAGVRPFVKRIFVHLPDTETAIHRCEYLGASGFVLSLPPRPTRMMVMGAAKWLLRESAMQTAHSCIDQIDNEDTFELVRIAGIRFGAGAVFRSREFRGDAHPSAIEVYMADAARDAARSCEAQASRGPLVEVQH